MKIRFTLFCFCLLALFLSCASPVSAAYLTTGDQVWFSDPNTDSVPAGTNWRYGNGGAFNTHDVGGNVANFLTFCLELNETIAFNLPNKYYISLETGAIKGGNSGGNPDPLNTKTAYLYSHFIHGTLDDEWGASPPSYEDLSRAVQEAVWDIEGEATATGANALALITLAGNNANNTLYDVRVMNLWDTAELTGARQSMLYVIPEPSTMTMWALCGVCGLMYVRRRRKAAK